MVEDKDPWKRRFFLLVNNQQADEDLPDIWSQFKRERIEQVNSAIGSIRDKLLENERREVDKLCRETPDDEAKLLRKMKDCRLLGDHFWRLLFAAIRDRESKPIGNDKKVPIMEGGQTHLLTMEDIEDKFWKENQDILKSCKSVPDQMIHEDSIDAFLNVNALESSLRKSYDLRLEEAKTTLAAENPKLNADELGKQAAAHAKKETKESREAKLLQHRLAMKAEEEVQRSIQRAMAKFNIPVYVFRGVNTNDAVGKFLKSFDIKMSKLKGFKPGEKKNRSLECEHDIGALALLPTGPLASFVQVGL